MEALRASLTSSFALRSCDSRLVCICVRWGLFGDTAAVAAANYRTRVFLELGCQEGWSFDRYLPYGWIFSYRNLFSTPHNLHDPFQGKINHTFVKTCIKLLDLCLSSRHKVGLNTLCSILISHFQQIGDRVNLVIWYIGAAW